MRTRPLAGASAVGSVACGLPVSVLFLLVIMPFHAGRGLEGSAAAVPLAEALPTGAALPLLLLHLAAVAGRPCKRMSSDDELK